jgi:hypothetical protein
MRVSMVDIRIVGMRMFQPLVPVGMVVRFAGRIFWTVHMLVVFIMNMWMFVEQRFMRMSVLMAFSNV